MRIIVIRLDRIGDAVMTQPVLPALRELYPDAEMVLVMMAAPASLFLNESHVNKVIGLPDKRITTLVQSAFKLGRFDIALNMVPDYRGSLLALLSGRKRFGRGWWLTQRVLERDGIHEVERNLDVVRLLGPIHGSYIPELQALDEERNRVGILLKQRGAPEGEPIVLVHIGASLQWPEKRWPARQAAQVLDGLMDLGLIPVLVGGPEDIRAALEVARISGGRAVNLTGVISLRELLALSETAAVAVGTDSGPVHTAAAAGAPTITLFGPTDPGQFRPMGRNPQHKVIRHDPGHPPCNVPGGCPDGCDCMNGIKAVDVLSAVREVVQVGA